MAELARDEVKQMIETARNKQKRLDFSKKDLSGANLSGMHFNRVNFTETNLRTAYLVKTDFTIAHLVNADLREANLNWDGQRK